MAESKAQFRFAAMSASLKGRKKLRGKAMPVKVAKEMINASKGKFKKLPAHKSKKK